eukprot:CAMPEP_0182427906 /NCGR_PEP_ID=MMETSP1167-20130531/20759_1 /TAXON_ID=2988 /ORGANISM="Mallomonas Sp, Strain CCMP3275" /LENGTH=176 /DNA_ID=CAMNT_0024610487 /DNA_START=53 /DNA_END=583 /DNA_ORIENTATION=-
MIAITAIIFASALLSAQAFRPGVRSLSMLKVGEVAPDFALKNAAGKEFKLSTILKNKKTAVVFFYPADSTPGCTKEVCAFDAKAPDFKKKGAEVFGISSGGVADKQKFIRDTNLKGFELLIDAGDVTRKSWQVPKALFGAFPGRVTYVIGKDGKVIKIVDDLANTQKHVDESFSVL